MTDSPTGEVIIKGNAILLPLRVKPSLSNKTLTLETDDGQITLKCPVQLFPFAEVGQVLFVTLGAVMATLEAAAPTSSLILPPQLVQ